MKILSSRLVARIHHYVENSNPFTSAEIDGDASDEEILLAYAQIGPRTEHLTIERSVRTSVEIGGHVVSVVSEKIETPRQYKVDRFPHRTIRHGAIEVAANPMYKGILRLITHPIAKRTSVA